MLGGRVVRRERLGKIICCMTLTGTSRGTGGKCRRTTHAQSIRAMLTPEERTSLHTAAARDSNPQSNGYILK